MNILVTGGTGFIGSHLINALLRKSYRVILIKRSFSDTWRIDDLIPEIKTYDVDKQEDLSYLFEKNRIDLIIHLATKYIKHHQNSKDIELMNYTNITFPSLLIDAAAKYNVKSFINTGTCFEYKSSTKKIKETDKLKPYNYYAATKLAFEEILKFYADANRIRAITLKLFYPYGQKDNQKIIPLIIKSILKNKPLSLTKRGQKLNFTYVEDIVDAYIKSIDYINSDKYLLYDTFNIGAGKAYRLIEIIKMIEQISKRRGKLNIGEIPYSINEIMYMNCDYSKAKRKLDWYPKVSIKDGLKKTYAYYYKGVVG